MKSQPHGNIAIVMGFLSTSTYPYSIKNLFVHLFFNSRRHSLIYLLHICEVSMFILADILNECSSTPCKNGGQCKNLLGSFECDCPQNVSGKQCEVGKNENCKSVDIENNLVYSRFC